VTDHPTLEELGDFARGKLESTHAATVMRHLLRGCRTCRPELREPLRLAPAPAPALKDYDAPIARAFEAARAFQQKRESERRRAQQIVERLEQNGEEGLGSLSPATFGPILIEALLERSWALRHENPAQMRDLAHLAQIAASRLSFAKYGEELVADLRCRAWAEYANACRVSECLDEAEAAFQQAYIHQFKGSADPMVTARLMDLHASLFRARRKFARAYGLHIMVHEIYTKLGQRHHAGRALLSMGMCIGYAGEPEKALKQLERGLKMVDESYDPEIVFFAVHNLIWFKVECGRFEEAQKLVFLNRWRYQSAARLNRIKLRWLEARIDAGLGRHERAVNVFSEVHDDFVEAGSQDFPAALASLDMALSLLRQSKTDEARDVVMEAAEIFRSLEIEREMLLAVLFLHQTFSLGLARITVLEDVIGFIRRAEHDPEAKFEPRPL
jgi:hypothetical protein